MSDIIQDAKDTVAGKQETPWQKAECIEAISEERYEYAVQVKIGSRWEYKQDGFFRDAWFPELRKAKAGARELRSIGKETRIVRRRVSTVEVVNDNRFTR